VRRAGPQPITTSTSSPTLAKRPSYQRRSRDAAARGGGGVEDEESSWLLRTASALQMRGLEERGQGWMVKRSSSTSLVRDEVRDRGEDVYTQRGDVDTARDDVDVGMRSAGRSAAESRYASRRGSRVQSRAGSGVDLRRDGLRALTRINRVDEEGGVRGMEGPDFVDPAVFEEDEGGSGEEEEVDEGEMRRVVMGRARGWVDWAVGWMDFRGEEEVWEGGEGEGGGLREGETDDEEVRDGEGRRRRGRGGEARGFKGGEEVGQRAVAGPAPQGEGKGVVADAKWLLGVASKIIV